MGGHRLIAATLALRPDGILNPRLVRLGARLTF